MVSSPPPKKNKFDNSSVVLIASCMLLDAVCGICQKLSHHERTTDRTILFKSFRILMHNLSCCFFTVQCRYTIQCDLVGRWVLKYLAVYNDEK